MKLLNMHREGLLKAILAHGFDKKQEELRLKFCALADEIYEEVFGPHAKAMEKMPAWFFKNDTNMELANLRHEHYCHRFELTKPRLMPRYTSIPVPAALVKKGEKLNLESNQFHEEKAKRKGEVERLLASFSTLGALEKAWPEVMSLAPEGLLQVAMLPMVQVSKELNKALGLPVKEQE